MLVLLQFMLAIGSTLTGLQEGAASSLKWDSLISEGDSLETVTELFSTNKNKISPEHDKSPAHVLIHNGASHQAPTKNSWR